MQLQVDPKGNIVTLYGEMIDLAMLGTLSIRRASSVEPDEHGRWFADLAIVGGPRLGPFRQRSQALQAETIWLERYLFAGTTKS